MSSIEKNIYNEMRQAIKNGNLELVKNLLKKNKGLLNVMTPFGTWLQVAASRGQIDIVKYLIKCGIDVNERGEGMAEGGALTDAAFRGHLKIVKYLYRNGAELDVSNGTRNPLFAAIYNGHFDVVKFLVEKGIDITASYHIGKLDNVDAYEYARQFGQTEIANYLKEKLDKLDA